MDDDRIKIERIEPTPWTDAHIQAAMTGVVPVKVVTLEEYKRQFQRTAKP